MCKSLWAQSGCSPADWKMNPITLAENWCSVFDCGRFLRWLCVGGRLRPSVHQRCAVYMSANVTVLMMVERNASFTSGPHVGIFVYPQIQVRISNFWVFLKTACESLLIRQPKVCIGLHLNWAWITAKAYKGNWLSNTWQRKVKAAQQKKLLNCLLFLWKREAHS